ncbi:MAG: substrate-binding domain-containing protein, partial [Hungatella sp.]
NIYSTVCDDRAAIRSAAQKLITSGHRDIVYLYSSNSYSGQNKLQGYKDAFMQASVPFREELIHQCPKDLLVAKDLLLHLRESGLHFDAVMTSDDSLAVGAVKFAHTAGIHIPEELSIIGYNNSTLSYCTDPEITSIDTKVEALCTTTINTLMGVFGGGNVPSKTTIAADLIQRQTTNF